MATDPFQDEVLRLRAAYDKQRDSTNLVPPLGQLVAEIGTDVYDNGVCWVTYWYELDENEPEKLQAVRLADIEGTLSGSILRLEKNLPDWSRDGHGTDTDNYEILGNDIRRLSAAPPLPKWPDDDEDIKETLAQLPEVKPIDKDRHFVKRGKYVSEIQNLLACQGGTCPGSPESDHVLQLLGRTSNGGELVFPLFRPRVGVLAPARPLIFYKTWILQLIEGLRCVHAHGIIYRDLRIDNLVFGDNDSDNIPRLVIADLEGRWGNRAAPELSHNEKTDIKDVGWTEQSDIYDIGTTIKGMIYANTPITAQVAWPVPAPLEGIVAACLQPRPEDRPCLEGLQFMVERFVV